MTLNCPHCEAVLADANARWQHVQAKHPDQKANRPRRRKRKGAKPTAEIGEFASLAIEAEMLSDAGRPVPEDIAWLLP